MNPQHRFLIPLIVLLIIHILFLSAVVALQLIISPDSVPVTVNPPGGFDVGPGWNF